MRILDQNGTELTNPDLSVGYLVQERIVTAQHPAVEAVEGIYRTEYKNYPNGGRDLVRITEVPPVEPQEAWGEYETIQRYILYTPEELAELSKPTPEERIQELEEALDMLLSGTTE